jgi:hypothetical protein
MSPLSITLCRYSPPVVVVAVDNNYVDLSASQRSGSEQTAEATADNGDPMAGGRWSNAHRASR